MRAVVRLMSVLAGLGDAPCAGSVQVVCVRTATKEKVVNGIETLASAFGPKETMDRLEAATRSKGMTVFARIDHAAGAASVGLVLRPTELLIFGNAKAGTPLMQVNQAIGLDLPLKARFAARGRRSAGWHRERDGSRAHGRDEGRNATPRNVLA